MGYKRIALQGISWIGAFRVISRVVALVRTALLARLLTPEQFGTFGIAVLVLAIIEVFTETGISVLFIQDKQKIDRYIDTAWVISIIRGVVIALLIVLTAPFISRFFNSPASYILLLVTSVVPIIRGFINPSVVKFQKELEFKQEFWFRSSIFIVESLVAVSLAFVTREAISLILGFIAGAFLEVMLSFVFMKPMPRFSFNKTQVTELFRRGKWVTMAGIFNYLFHNLDNIIVGKMLGITSLGLYQMGYRLATLPVGETIDTVARVTFPIYVKISDDYKRLRRAFLKSMLVVMVLILPVCIILFLFAKEIVLLVLGPHWSSIVPVVRVLAVFGILQVVTAPHNALYLAVGKQQYGMVVALIRTLGLTISIFPLVIKFGITGAALSALIGSVMSLFVVFYYTFKILVGEKR